MKSASALTFILVALLAGGALHGGNASPAARQGAPVPASPVVISGEVLGRARPVMVDIPELALGRVTIMPGAVIPVHRHPGTQVAMVIQGTLTYTVYTGDVAWHKSGSTDGEATMILPGETVQVGAGDALIEEPTSIHQGQNNGPVPVIIYLSTLFPAGAPRSIIVDATPVP